MSTVVVIIFFHKSVVDSDGHITATRAILARKWNCIAILFPKYVANNMFIINIIIKTSRSPLCIALYQVGLWKSHAKHRPESGCFVAHQKLVAQRSATATSTSSSISMSSTIPRNLQSYLQREMELLRSSRDAQVEEAMLFNQKLEKELSRSREAAGLLEECNRTLKREQQDMRKKVEEARQAVITGLAKVKDLEAKARRVPVLQQHVQQLEMELLYYR